MIKFIRKHLSHFKLGVRTLIVIVTAMCLVIVPLFLHDNVQFYFTWLSAVSGLATMLLAFSLYDKLDSKKAAFGRELDAVDNLTKCLFNVEFYFLLGNRLQYSAKQKDGSVVFQKFFINTSNLEWANNEMKNNSTNNLRVLFSEGIVNDLRHVSHIAQNIWVPIQIKNALKPLFIGKPHQVIVDDTHQFLLVTTDEERYKQLFKYYSLHYDELQISNHEDYLIKISLLVNELEQYYKDRLGVIPDLSAH